MNIPVLLFFLLFSTFYTTARQVQIGAPLDNIQFSQIISGNDSSLYFLGKKNYNDYFILKTNLQLDTVWSLTCSSSSNYSNVRGYQLPGSSDLFIWDDDSTLLRITQSGQIVSNSTISIPGMHFSGLGGMLYHHDSLLLALNFKDSIFHCGIALADTNLNFTNFHEYTNQYITDFQQFGQAYYLKSSGLIFLDSSFNFTGEMCLDGYSQYVQGSRSFGTGNVMKVNDSLLFVHQYAHHSYEPNNNDQYFVLDGSGNYSAMKDDFDFEPSFNYQMLHCFSDGRKILLGENSIGGVYVYTLDSLYNPVSAFKIFQDTSGYAAFMNPAIFLNDQIYFAHKNIIGTIDSLGNTCNTTSAVVNHESGFTQDVYSCSLNDSSYSLANSIFPLQNQIAFRGISLTDYCNMIGVEQLETNEAFKIYPNPINAAHEFQIASDEIFTRIEIRTITGTLVCQINNPESVIKLPELSEGVYAIMVANQKNTYSGMLIIQ